MINSTWALSSLFSDISMFFTVNTLTLEIVSPTAQRVHMLLSSILLVDDHKCRLMTKYLEESTEVVFDKANTARLNDIRQKISCVTINKIKLELSKSIISEKLTKECKFLLRYKYLLQCYHTLTAFDIILICLIPRH
ncbi:hypothetical protein PHYBLDRAFT_173471 [Phycomyces blakesleeanus NRRL 1555(-)]|uniref:Uncharacterized protein n=1 Tax=Phycomyces blakesleeanus (strain ATCC 8743b / DSM 1359 / FGSC 10004 / NBRC 33097 / NRRL 1555) TaxID=763407 RepID=A0A162ZQV6_PHYB8|nr:hypothetical protein PHYBLDRAFT_173471 [Phycomyces blakesleeanus NRRL 1555(-)]OAD68481.1 hypothetical protein PHYBLDRAFT_173471 [Phycomyces blakesleeanus NRRL 1555(-)]|eukprot:XP_018286521.1 hypothetical protein PHYBLDRAFT_173471 [Phycomyces blakesleeanus NRRL 1555(-)]